MTQRYPLAVLTSLFLLLSPYVFSEPARKAPREVAACTDQNLLIGRAVTISGAIHGNLAQLVDGKTYENNALWNLPGVVVLPPESSILFDLGEETAITAGWIQADNNDLYVMEGSNNGKDYFPLLVFGALNPQGLQTRFLSGFKSRARYLRLAANSGDGFYSISELGLFCQTPAVFPPHTEVMSVPKVSPWDAPLNDYQVTVYKVVLASLGLLLVLWGVYLHRQGETGSYARTRMMLLGALALLSFASYYNFFRWHFHTDTHTWEVYHYYLGSKYFPELRYTGLYECTTLADVEEGIRAQGSQIRDHRTNTIRDAQYILDNPHLCKERFSEERWNAFQHDLRWFRGMMNPTRWEEAQRDHGYNPPPVMTMIARGIGFFFETTTDSMRWLVRLDILLVLVAFAFIGWAFGWQGLGLAVIVWGLNYPARYYWIGGAYLRQSWFASAMIGLALLKKEKSIVAGVMLTLSTLITIFPVFFLMGMGVKMAHQWITTKVLSASHRRFVLGVLLGGMALVILSLPGSGGGWRAYRDFAYQMSVHMGTPLTNNMGLKTVMGYRPAQKSQNLMTSEGYDPFAIWKQERVKAFQSVQGWYWGIVLLGLALFWRAARRAEDWEAAALGFVLIPLFTELTCYYYSFVVAGALLSIRKPLLGMVLMVATIAWLVSEFYWDWFDVKYTYNSLIAVLLCFCFLFVCSIGNQPHGGEPQKGH